MIPYIRVVAITYFNDYMYTRRYCEVATLTAYYNLKLRKPMPLSIPSARLIYFDLYQLVINCYHVVQIYINSPSPNCTYKYICIWNLKETGWSRVGDGMSIVSDLQKLIPCCKEFPSYFINSSRPNDVYMCQYNWPSLVQMTAWRF